MQRQRPSFLSTATTPLHALCRHFNLHPTVPLDPIGPTFNMQVIRDAHMPTHVLAVTSPDNKESSSSPIMLPIDITLFEQGFRFDLNPPPSPPGSIRPIPYTDTVGDSQVLMVTLPVISITVPHPSSFPLLLLFGMKLESQLNLLAWRLLPINVVEEFPNAAAMSLIFSRSPNDSFSSFYRQNQGIWKNTLALGIIDQKLAEVVQTAWNVTAETRRIRQRAVAQ